ncbi:aldo/keto reductase [Flavihumibacter profundi]|uniref:aldo/keto reductase n=1 Tax=Flavihumibacter profundi TaxID=2716883 RepID=UPI001CC356C1|nr:aldo/keto reductase [Flavihumibacter profundi]MBZ5856427.1 aldo/keto reductase [Flavihumibacter profundi]
MELIKLGKSGIAISPMTIGCWSFGGGAYWGNQSQKDVDEVVHAAIDMGINCFDTAELYNGGESEKSLGLAIQGYRPKIVICSKISPSNCRNVRKHCEESLQRLKTDYIDIYMVHWPLHAHSLKHFTKDTGIINNPPTAAAVFNQLNELKKAGLIRSIGISNFGVTQMKEAVDTAVQVDVNEMPYNILSRAIELEVAPFCLQEKISLIGSMGLQQGLLTGKYRSAGEVPYNQAHSRHFANQRGNGTSRHGGTGEEAEVFKILDELRVLSEELQINMTQVSIAWIMAKPFIASTLVGSRTIDQLKTNVAACSIELSKDVVAEIDRISQTLLTKLGPSPDYYESPANSRIF